MSSFIKPNDSPCGICGGENNNFDDCGWWYVLQNKVHSACTDYEIWDREGSPNQGFFVPNCGCLPIKHFGER